MVPDATKRHSMTTNLSNPFNLGQPGSRPGSRPGSSKTLKIHIEQKAVGDLEDIMDQRTDR